MATQFGLRTSKKLMPILAAFAFFGLSACGDSSAKNECAGVTCETPAPYCDGETAVSYASGGTCIESTGVCDIAGVERRLDCTARGETCIEGFCKPAPLCDADSCAQPEPTCVGATNLITYSGAGVCDDADGSCDFAAVSTTIDCADDGMVCNNGACETVELCGDGACAQPEDTCEGTNLITYSGAGICDESDGSCDYAAVSTTVDCADDGKVCQLGECVDEAVDLCDGVTCDAAPAASCDGDTAVTYSDDTGVCLQTDGSCDYSAKKVETDCSADGKICDAGACVDPAALCDGVTCDQPPAASCDGDFAVTYTANNGVCVEVDGSCDYSAEEVRTDCSADGKSCSAGVCVVTADHSVNAGDLIITEIMADPAAVTDANGEYFEVYNTTSRTLHINGLVVTDKGSGSFTVSVTPEAPVEVAPGEYFVFGKNDDLATNGGVNVDYQWGSFTLTNSADKVILTMPGAGTNPDVEIDRVEYGSGTGYPAVTAGAAMQFGRENDFADHGDATLWCNSTEPINPTDTTPDFGTPGAANTPCN